MPLPEVRRKTPLLTACRVVRARGYMLPKGMDHVLSWQSQLQSQSHNRLYLHLPESKHFNSELKEQTLYYESTQAGTKHIPLKEMKAAYKSNLVMSRTSGAQIKVHFHFLAAVATNYISAEPVQTFYIQRISQQKHCQSCWMYSIAAILICMVLVSNQYSPLLYPYYRQWMSTVISSSEEEAEKVNLTDWLVQQQALKKEVRWLRTDVVLNCSPLTLTAGQQWPKKCTCCKVLGRKPFQHSMLLDWRTTNIINTQNHTDVPKTTNISCKREFSPIEQSSLCYKGLNTLFKTWHNTLQDRTVMYKKCNYVARTRQLHFEGATMIQPKMSLLGGK